MFRHFIYVRSRSPASTNTPSAFPFHHKDKKKDTTLRCVVSPKQSVGNRCWNATNIVSTKTFRFFAMQIYKLFLYRSCDLLFFSHIPIDVSHQTGVRNNREIVVICLFCRRLFDKIEHFLLTLSEFRLRHVSVMISDILGVGRGKN